MSNDFHILLRPDGSRQGHFQDRISVHLWLPVVLTATVFAFMFIGRKSLWLDEAYSIAFVSRTWSDLWTVIRTHEGQSGLYYLVLKPWVTLFGDTEVALRSLSAVFAVGAVGMTYAGGVRLGGRITGLIGSLVLAVNTLFISYAQEARGYSLLMLLVAAGMYVFVLAIETGKFKYFVMHGVLTSLAIHAHLFAVFVGIAQLLSLAFLPRRTVRWRGLFTSAAVAFTLTVPLALYVLLGDLPSYGWIGRLSFKQVYRVLVSLPGKGTALSGLYLVCALSGAIAASLVARKFGRSYPAWRHALILLWTTVPILCLFLMSLVRPFFIVRYSLAVLPGLALLVGSGIVALRQIILRSVLVAALVTLSIYSLFSNYYHDDPFEWRRATDLVTDSAVAEDVIVFYSALAQIPFEYYFRRSHEDSGSLASAYPYPFGSFAAGRVFVEIPEITDRTISTVCTAHDRIWLLLAHDRISSFGFDSRPVITWFEDSCALSGQFVFNGIELRLYQQIR